MYCHFPLYTVFSLISSLNFYINYSRTVLHIPSNPIPCIVFVLPYIPLLFYIYPLLPCIFCVLPYIPVSVYIYTLVSPVSSLLSYISTGPSAYTLYYLVSSLFSHISPSPSTYTPSYLPYCLCYLIYPLALLHIPSTPLYRVKETDLILIANGLVPTIELDSIYAVISPRRPCHPRSLQ